MAIKVGDKIPSVPLKKMGGDGPEPVDPTSYFGGRKVVLFSVPGAFTPTCSAKHLPGFIQHVDAIKAKGVDAVACLAVNDAFVMGAWGESQGADGKVDMLADGSAKFTEALGLELDLVEAGLGVRGQRFALIVEDGTVTHVAIEEPGAFEVSSAEAILEAL
ncbi:MAG: peroxiredoxin [Alphaproteobacteria bacterium]|nr:peroxiredoxin [Alphaproteobacteria bacterium]